MTPPPQPTLLLLSTHPHFIYLIARYGERSGYRVIPVATADNALEMLRVERPAMLLLHLTEGPPDGWATLRRLQTDPAMDNIPITVVSALADESRARAEGAAHWRWPPVMYAEFLSVLTRS
jgi:CheY-like chemotaxis protein